MKDLWRLLKLFGPYRLWLAGGIALSVVVILSNVALLALSGWFITAMALAGLSAGSINYFTPAAVIRGLSIIRSLGRYAERLVTHDATLRLLSRLRVWFYSHLEPLAPAGLEYYRGGDLLSRIRADIDTLDNFYLRVLAPSVAAGLSGLTMIGFMAFYSQAIALVDLAGLLLVGVALPWLAQYRAQKPGAKTVALTADLRANMADFIRGNDELHIHQALARHAGQVERLSRALISPQRHQAWIDALATAVAGLVTRLCLWLALVVAIPLVASGQLGGADLAMVAFFILASFEAVQPLPTAFRSLGESRAAARRIFELVDTRPPVTEPDQEVAPPVRFDIAFTNVSLHYAADGSTPALDRVGLHVAAGERLGIVGPTGSGKSSLFQLLLRFRDYRAGEVRIGGTALSAWGGATIRGWCAVVSQQTHLFNASIRDNLLLANPQADDQQLWQALADASLFETVQAMPDGLDTVLGETGSRLSGGQARRLAIARAWLKHAPILLLDEPTEGLDAETEQLVLSALQRLMVGKTVLLITHRPQALQYVDRVAVFDRGRVVEQGDLNYLLRNGHYLDLYSAID